MDRSYDGNGKLALVRDIGIAIIAVIVVVAVIQNHQTISKVDNNRISAEMRDLRTLNAINYNVAEVFKLAADIKNLTKELVDNPQTTLEEQRVLFQDVGTALKEIEANQNLTKKVLQEQINQLKPPRATEERQIKAEQDHFNQTAMILSKIGVSANETQLQAREIQENATTGRR